MNHKAQKLRKKGFFNLWLLWIDEIKPQYSKICLLKYEHRTYLELFVVVFAFWFLFSALIYNLDKLLGKKKKKERAYLHRIIL